MLVFTTVFGIHCNIFVVLPIQLKISKSNIFSFFTPHNVCNRNTKCALEFCEVEFAQSASDVRFTKACFLNTFQQLLGHFIPAYILFSLF